MFNASTVATIERHLSDKAVARIRKNMEITYISKKVHGYVYDLKQVSDELDGLVLLIFKEKGVRTLFWSVCKSDDHHTIRGHFESHGLYCYI